MHYLLQNTIPVQTESTKCAEARIDNAKHMDLIGHMEKVNRLIFRAEDELLPKAQRTLLRQSYDIVSAAGNSR